MYHFIFYFIARNTDDTFNIVIIFVCMENNYITFSKPPVLYPIMFTATRSPSSKLDPLIHLLIVYGVTINLPTINKMTKATAIEIIHSIILFQF